MASSTTASLAASPAFTFSASTFQKLHPTEYFRKFVSQGVRPDGRLLNSFRPTTVHQGVITTANGSAMVRIGGTTVVCGIKAEVAEPKMDTPDQGYLGRLARLPSFHSLFLSPFRLILSNTGVSFSL
jgi:exosome complex component RRP43